MNIYLLAFICIISLPIESMRASRPVKIATLAARVQRQQLKVAAMQAHLVNSWRLTPPKKLTSKQIDALAYAVSKHYAVKDLQKHQHLLQSAVINFALTPGFSKVLGKLFDQADKCAPYFKGTLFEIEKALEIQRAGTREQVLAFNHIIRADTQRGYLCREFDIVTNRRFIECKAVNWQTLGINTPQIQKQLLDQQAIIKALGIRHHKELPLHLCSRDLIPDNWRMWLDQEGISYSW